MLVVFLLLSFLPAPFTRSSDASEEQKRETIAPTWEVCNKMGMTHFVYISPAGLKDKDFVAQTLNTIVHKFGRGKLIEINIFDDRRFCPTSFPMTDGQMLHWKAQYNCNPNNKFEEFAWISVIDPKSSPPKLKRTKANIRPGFAE
jgi:hypothetical protein